MTTIRVAHLHSSLGIYGAELWTDTLVRHLDAAKVRSIVATVDNKACSRDFHDYLVKKGVDAVHFPIGGRLNLRLIYKLRKFLKYERIDVLHTHGFKADILGYFASLGVNAKIVSTPHGWSADESHLIAWYEKLDRTFLSKFDAIYTLSPAMTNDLRSTHPEPKRIKLVLNAVDINRLEKSYEERRKHPRQRLNILFVGRLCKPKGVFELLRAFSRLDKRLSATLRFVGDGPELIPLQTLANDLGLTDRIFFEGYVADTRPFLRDASMLVLPSYSEGIPRTIMEAFAIGLPVIGTSIPGIQHLVTDNETGILVPRGSVDELATAIQTLGSNHELGDRISRNARQKIVSAYSGERLARDFEAHYLDLCTFADETND